MFHSQNCVVSLVLWKFLLTREMAQNRVCGEGERSCASLSWGVWDEETAPTCDGTTRTVAVTSGLADVQQGQCEIKGKAQELELPPPRPSHLWPQIRVELQEQLLYLWGNPTFLGVFSMRFRCLEKSKNQIPIICPLLCIIPSLYNFEWKMDHSPRV